MAYIDEYIKSTIKSTSSSTTLDDYMKNLSTLASKRMSMEETELRQSQIQSNAKRVYQDSLNAVSLEQETDRLSYLTKPRTTINPIVSSGKTIEQKPEKATFGENAKAVVLSAWKGLVNATRQNVTTGQTEAQIKQRESEVDMPSWFESLLGKTAIARNQEKEVSATQKNIASKTASVIEKTEQARYERSDKMLAYENKLDKEINKESKGKLFQLGLGAIESIPMTGMSALGGAGFALMFNQGMRNSFETSQKRIASGEKLNKSDVTIKAFGDGAIEVVTEMLFDIMDKSGLIPKGTGTNLVRGIKKWLKIGGKEVAEKTVKEIGKMTVKEMGIYIAKKANEEGMEEVIGALGSGLLAKLTTDKDIALFGKDKESLISFMGLVESYAGGFIGGTMFAGTSTTAQRLFSNYTQAKSGMESMSLEEIAENPELVDKLVDALAEDMQNSETRDYVVGTITPILEQDIVTKIDKMSEEELQSILNPQPSEVEIKKLKSATVYHGTMDSFDSFSKIELGKRTGANSAKEGFFFATNRKVAESYADQSIKFDEELTRLKTEIATETGEDFNLATTKWARGAITGEESYSKEINKKISRASKFQEKLEKANDEYNGKARVVGNVKKTKLNIQKPFVFDANESDVRSIGITDIIKKAKADGYDSVIIQNTFDSYIGALADEMTDIYVVFNETATTPPKTDSTIKAQSNTKGKSKAVLGVPQSVVEPSKAQANATEEKESEFIKEKEFASREDEISNIISPRMAKILNDKSDNDKKSSSMYDGLSDTATTRLKKSNETAPSESLFERLRDFIGVSKKNITLGSVPIDYKYGNVRVAFRKLRNSSRMSAKKAEEIIALSYNKAKRDIELFNASILFLDLMEDITNGVYLGKTEMPFGLTEKEIVNKAKWIRAQLLIDTNADIVDALQTRKRLMDEVRTELVELGKKYGIDYSIVFRKSDYMYHAIIDFNDELSKTNKFNKKRKRIVYDPRTGSARDFIANPLYADHLVMSKMMRNIAKVRLYGALKEVGKKLTFDEKHNPIIEDGYSLFDGGQVGVNEYYNGSTGYILKTALAKMVKTKINPQSSTGKKRLSRAVKSARNVEFLIPTEIAEAIENEFKFQDQGISKMMFRNITSVWKFSKIRLPNAVIRYNIRNMFGDLDAVLIGEPMVMTKVMPAFKELTDYYFKKGKVTPQLLDFIEKTGLTTGQTFQDLKSLETSTLFEFMEGNKNLKSLAQGEIKKIWKTITLQAPTEFREQILRYAAYQYYMDKWGKTTTGNPTNFAASNRAEIMSITDVKDKAAKWSDDLLGAYDDVSILGQWLAEHVMPFFRFKEVNIKRYYRIIKNVMIAEPSATLKMGNNIAQKLGVVGRVGGSTLLRMGLLGIRIVAFYGALQLFSNIFGGDDEEKLPESVKNIPHITIPSWLTGEPDRVYYIDRLGSFFELFNFVGIDYSFGKDLKDIFTGRMSVEDKMKEIAKSPINEVFNSSHPFYKLGFELITKKEYFPDPSNPKQMRSMGEYIFRQFGLSQEFKALTGMPQLDSSYGKEKRAILFTDVAQGEAALWDVYEFKEDFVNRFNLPKTGGSSDSQKSRAAYYYKQAIKLNDMKAAEKYLTDYALYGGTKETLDQSLASMHPLNGMKTENREAFVEWLTPEQKLRYEEAMNYINGLIELGTVD